jgi:hypothetical protein
MGNEATAGDVPKVPNLAVAINAPPPRGQPSIDPIEAQQVEAVLQLLYDNLLNGVEAAWGTPEGKGNIENSDSLDEQWARLITEKLLFLPYQGPNNYGYVSGRAEKVFWQKMIDPVDPAYPIVACCQQLASMAAISRGFDGLAEKDIGATSAENVETVGGRVIPKGDAQLGPQADSSGLPLTKLDRALTNKVGPDPGSNLELTPGSCYVRTGADHVAFFVRVDREKKLAQFFDTGAMTDKVPQSPWPKALDDLQTWPGIYDYHWQPDVSKTLKHWGFLPRDDEKLAKGIERLKRTRPLGFARIVLRARASNKLVFATPLLLMYGPQPSMNFSIARFLGALRGMMGREKLEGLVFIYIPQRVAHGNEKYDDQNALMLRLKDPPLPPEPAPPTPPGPHPEYAADDQTFVKTPREVTLREMVDKVRELKNSPNWSPSAVWANNAPADYKCIAVLHTMADLEQKEVTDQWGKHSIWKTVPNTFAQGLAGVRNWQVSPPSSGTTVWKPAQHPPTDLASYHLLPWDRPSHGKDFGTEEDWLKLDWSKFEYFKGSWDGSQWNVI